MGLRNNRNRVNNRIPRIRGPLKGNDMVFFALILLVLIYILPTLIALSGEEHPHSGAIMVLNLLLGWTVIGWVGSLLWALVRPRKGLTAAELRELLTEASKDRSTTA